MRLLKIGLITISTAIIILIIALWVITTQINPNHYKSWIESTINKQTGLTLNIEGDLSWKFFPQIQLNVGRSQLNNPPSFNSTKLASFDQANLSVALFPLIKKDIQIQGISLVNANINLETNAKGQNNWEMLSELQKSNEQATQISEANFLLASHQNYTQNKSDTQVTESNLNLKIQQIDLQNAEIYYQNHTNNTWIKVESLNFSSQNLEANQWANLSLDAAITSSFDINGSIKWKTELQFNDSFSHFQIQQANFSNEITSESISPQLKKPYKLSLTVSKLSFEKIASQNLKHHLIIKDTNLKTEAGTIRIDANIQNLPSEPIGEMELQAIEIKPHNLAKLAGHPPVDGSKLLKSLSGKTNIQFDSNRWTAKPITWKLDDTTLTGTANGSLSAPIDIDAKINIDELNIDKYMPVILRISSHSPKKSQTSPSSPSKSDTQTSQSSKTTTANNTKPFTYNIILDLLKLTAYQTNWENINIAVNGSTTDIKLKNLTADGYNGHIKANGAAKLQEQTSVEATYTINDIQLLPLLKDIEKTDLISGAITASGNIRTHGANPNDFTHNLNGTGELAVKNGKLLGVDLEFWWHSGRALINGRANDYAAKKPPSTEFLDLNTNYTIKNGIIDNPNLKAYNHVLALTGQGTIDLNKQSLNYYLQVGESDSNFNFRSGSLIIPLKINGAFDKPGVSIDERALIKNPEVQKGVINQIKGLLGSDSDSKNSDGNNSGAPINKILDLFGK